MGKYHIETFDDLYADRAKSENDMNRLIEVRTKLQNKICRATPAEKETLREEKAGVTARIMELRKQLKMNKAIEERSVKIQEKIERILRRPAVIDTGRKRKSLCRIPKDADFTEKDGHTEYEVVGHFNPYGEEYLLNTVIRKLGYKFYEET